MGDLEIYEGPFLGLAPFLYIVGRIPPTTSAKAFCSVRPRSEDAILEGDVVYIAEPTSDNVKRNQGLIYFF
ncbi:hypothetical protein BofuT4_uP125350.1 [Botrytis cinerea T4]|uniref:Uncharacterized protein n=1 Tax=Botryotinia fuckeliana (strain T4) TaxID=999810 RepID=G2YS89_BOTF4|nr:hypothetical protein BofuT4_uP125350.1 [Botrytis cinerea T4]